LAGGQLSRMSCALRPNLTCHSCVCSDLKAELLYPQKTTPDQSLGSQWFALVILVSTKSCLICSPYCKLKNTPMLQVAPLSFRQIAQATDSLDARP